ncbi:MAG: TlpA family protein disulfide reductase [Terriglobia bacterium]
MASLSHQRTRIALALAAFLLFTVWLTHRAHRLERTLENRGDRPGGALIGQPAPDFTLPLLTSSAAPPDAPTQLALADHRGQLVFVSFWASWCRPCDYELPLLDNFYRDYRDRSVQVIAISTDSDRAAALRYARQHSFALSMVWDEGSRIADLYKVAALPTLVVIGPTGRILQVQRGLRYDLQSWLEAQFRAVFPRAAPQPAGAS